MGAGVIVTKSEAAVAQVVRDHRQRDSDFQGRLVSQTDSAIDEGENSQQTTLLFSSKR